MMRSFIALALIFATITANAQKLRLPKSKRVLTGSEFVAGIIDTNLSIAEREAKIYSAMLAGNIPDFYRKLVEIRDTATIDGKAVTVRYFVLPDYLAIGTNDDYFYCPMTPGLAQRIASKLGCNLPTRKISDDIYRNAAVKMVPEPIPPTRQMITVPVFSRHNELVRAQRAKSLRDYPPGSLVAGNKKDVVVSDKIFNDTGKLRVVIYGWHLPGGKAIQPLYNGHTPDWADYSHGVRLIQNKIWVDGKRSTVQTVLTSPELHVLLSDEGRITHFRYPEE